MSKISQICLAISLPVLTLLAFYLLKEQRKKSTIDSKNDDSINSTTNSTTNSIDGLKKNSVSGSTNEKIYSPTDKLDREANEELSHLSHGEIVVEQGSTSNAEMRQNDLIDKESSDLFNKTNEDYNLSTTNVSFQNNQSDKQIDQQKTIILNDTSSNEQNSTINLDDKDAIFLNNNDKHFQTKLDLSNRKSNLTAELTDSPIDDVSTEKDQSKLSTSELNQSNEATVRTNRSIKESNDKSINEKELLNATNEKLEQSDSKSEKLKKSNLNDTKSSNQSKLINKAISLEDMFDNELSSILISENGQLTDNMTNLTFNTCETSFDSTNATNNTTLDCSNCSNQTLCSQSKSRKENLSKQTLDNLKSNESILDNVAISEKEEVKEDLKSTTSNSTLNSSNFSNSNFIAKDSKDDDVNLEKQTICELEQSNINDIVSSNDEEKYLNVTEVEFKNDSKLEIVNEVVEDLKNKVSDLALDNSIIDKKDESINKVDNRVQIGKEEGDKSTSDKSTSDKSTDDFNKKEDESVCIIDESSKQIEDEPKLTAATSTEVNQTANLDDSDDLEIVFEGPPKPKPKVATTNGHSDNKNVKDATKNGNLNDNNETITNFVFEISQKLTGLLVGQKGSFLKPTMVKSNTDIFIKPHPMSQDLNLCRIEGTSENIETALNIIRSRFPLSKFPNVSLTPVNPQLFFIEPVTQLSTMNLPVQVPIECVISDFITPSHIFLHQYTHPIFQQLLNLEQNMTDFYTQNDAPTLGSQVAPGLICAVECDGKWKRASVLDNQNGCFVKLLDYGTCVEVQPSDLRQVSRDFMQLPFQATEVMLSNVVPKNRIWSEESVDFFRTLTCKKTLQSIVIGLTDDEMPLIRLFENNQQICINEALVSNGFADWID